TKYAALARKWYADEARILAIRDMATATRSFLVENEHTVKNDGQLDNAKPWWPRNYNPKEISPAAIDHRGIRMRQRALSFG
ncbi:hypothetical protein, partial [Klebsiella aerogenes]|uniref:hypothetical protein n=1 Tax=Klebsiella aerogenes TaxID=548 RepID=UPI0013D350AB